MKNNNETTEPFEADTWTERRGSAWERQCSCDRFYIPKDIGCGNCPQCMRERTPAREPFAEDKPDPAAEGRVRQQDADWYCDERGIDQ